MRALALALVALGLLAPAAPALAQTATPTVNTTPTPHTDVACPRVLVDYPRDGVIAGQEATISVKVQFASDDSRISLFRRSPTPVTMVRSATGTSAIFTVRLRETHQFTASVFDPRGGRCMGGGPEYVPLSIPVRPRVTIAATRSAVRSYAFTGRVLPGRGQAVSLYRVNADGSRVLTSRTTVQPDGTYRLDRRFTGSGRFGFVASVGPSATNVAGSSAVRATVIH